jgi:hypothetical protein
MSGARTVIWVNQVAIVVVQRGLLVVSPAGRRHGGAMATLASEIYHHFRVPLSRNRVTAVENQSLETPGTL